MNNIRQIAGQLLPKPQGKKVLKKSGGNTDDIISEIVNTHNQYWTQTRKFAPQLKGHSRRETASNIWNFIKHNIKYVLDPFGDQFIKPPARTWSDGFGDCKSYSLFIGSLLANLGIPFKYRFVSYSTMQMPTHVYVVIEDQGQEIYIDACLKTFDKEQRYTYKKDILMAEIYQVSGVNEEIGKLDLGDLENLTDGEMELRIMKQRLEIRKDNQEKVSGIGSPLAEKLQDQIDVVNESLKNIHDPIAMDLLIDDVENGNFSTSTSLSGIGAAARPIKRAQILTKLQNTRLAKRATIVNKLTKTQAPMLTKLAKGTAQKPAAVKIKKAAMFVPKKPLIKTHPNQKLTTPTPVKQNSIVKQSVVDPGMKMQAANTKKTAQVKNFHQGKNVAGDEYDIAFNDGVFYIGKKRKTKVGKALQKATQAVKKAAGKVAKAVVKVATAPLRLAAKGILEITLPKSSPFFLYLFITNQDTISKLPVKVAKKRKKAENIADFIVNGIGMKRPHFMGILRNGIEKHYKASPEAVLARSIKGSINGVGVIPLAIIPVVMELIQKVGKLFGKKGPEVSKDDAPDPENDFKGTDTAQFAKEISTQQTETDSNESGGRGAGGKGWCS